MRAGKESSTCRHIGEGRGYSMVITVYLHTRTIKRGSNKTPVFISLMHLNMVKDTPAAGG